MLHNKQSEKGQVLVLIVLAMIGMMGFVGLAMDGGQAFADRRQCQNAADGAALAAALTYQQENQSTTNSGSSALAAATANGYDGGANSDVTYTSATDNTCPGIPGKTFTVKIDSTVKTGFSSIVGVNEIKNTVTATSRACPPTEGALFNGAAVVALSKTESPAIKANGNSTVHLTGGGMFSNSSASGSNASASVWINESSLQISAPIIKAVGSIDNDSAVPDSTGATQLNITSDTFSFVPAPPAKPTCASSAPAATVSGGVTTYHPGNYTSSVSKSGSVVLEAGTYCFTKGATFSGTVIGQGTVKIVLSGTAVSNKLEVGDNNTWDNLEIFADKVGLQVASGGHLTANRLRFYGASGSYGTAEVGMIGTSTMDANDAYFYFEKGKLDWNGNTTLNLQAPTSGDYKGLLVYMPLGNTGSPPEYKVNGNSSTYTTGTWLMPSVDLGTNGNSEMNSLHSQFIVNTITFNGNCDFIIDYNAGENVGNPALPTIELTK